MLIMEKAEKKILIGILCFTGELVSDDLFYSQDTAPSIIRLYFFFIYRHLCTGAFSLDLYPRQKPKRNRALVERHHWFLLDRC